MTVEQYIVGLFEEKYREIDLNDERVIEGIKGYISDNRISGIFHDDEMSKRMVTDFMAPLFTKSADDLISYFKNYELIKRIKTVSNRIFSIAINKASGKPYEYDKSLEKAFFDCVYVVETDLSIKKSLEMLISDTIIEIDFLNGAINKYSLRMKDKLDIH